MQRDSEGLTIVSKCDEVSRRADIVFVHGLGGASHGTWTHGEPGSPGHFFWPGELASDLPDCRISTLGYPAGFAGLGKPGMIIEARAGNLAHKLANAGFGDWPIIFVTHSMGGLIVKSLLVNSQVLADPDRQLIAESVRGIVFCATPHRGSAFADAAAVFGKFVGGVQQHVLEMRANSDPIDFLHEKFIEWHRRHPVPVDSYAETVGLFRTRPVLRPVPLGLVVARASANTGLAGHTVRDVDEDHLSLVKPSHRNHDVYAGVLRFIIRALAEIEEARTQLKATMSEGESSDVPLVAMGFIDSDVEALHYSPRQADLRFSITNTEKAHIKIRSLSLNVVRRENVKLFRLPTPGAPHAEFQLEADVSEVDQTDLLSSTNVQFVLKPGETDAFSLAVWGSEGVRYTVRLDCTYEVLPTAGAARFVDCEAVLTYPIRTASGLRNGK